jgi:hypothetical protein
LADKTSASQSKTSCAITLGFVPMAWAPPPSDALTIISFDRGSGLAVIASSWNLRPTALPVLWAYGGRLPASRNREVRTFVY